MSFTRKSVAHGNVERTADIRQRSLTTCFINTTCLVQISQSLLHVVRVARVASSGFIHYGIVHHGIVHHGCDKDGDFRVRIVGRLNSGVGCATAQVFHY